MSEYHDTNEDELTRQPMKHTRYIVKHGPHAWYIMSLQGGNWWQSIRYETRQAARNHISFMKEMGY